MRMEAKNCTCKQSAVSSNFKNVSYSAAKKHQRLLCAHLQSSTFFDTQHSIKTPSFQLGNCPVHVHSHTISQYVLSPFPGCTCPENEHNFLRSVLVLKTYLYIV